MRERVLLALLVTCQSTFPKRELDPESPLPAAADIRCFALKSVALCEDRSRSENASASVRVTCMKPVRRYEYPEKLRLPLKVELASKQKLNCSPVGSYTIRTVQD